MNKKNIRSKFLLLAILVLSSFLSCSKESIDEEDVSLSVQTCEIVPPVTGCSIVYLEGEKSGWIRISSASDLEDPFFLYVPGQHEDPMGTVTINMNVKSPVIRINDSEITDILVQVSQSSTNQNEVCKSQENVVKPTSKQEPDVQIKFTEQFEFPFFIKIKANAC